MDSTGVPYVDWCVETPQQMLGVRGPQRRGKPPPVWVPFPV